MHGSIPTPSPFVGMLVAAIPAQALRAITVPFWKGSPTGFSVSTYASFEDATTPTAHEQVQAEATKAALLAAGFMEALANIPFLGATVSLRTDDTPMRISEEHLAHASSLELSLAHDGDGHLRFFHLERHQNLPLVPWASEPIITTISHTDQGCTVPIEHLSRLFVFLSGLQGPFHAWQHHPSWGARTFTGPSEPTALERIAHLHTSAGDFLQQGTFPTPLTPSTIIAYRNPSERLL